MKMKALFAAFVTIMLFALMSCKTSPKDAIVRKWKASDASGASVTPEIKNMLISTNSTIEFTKDGKYNSSMAGSMENGTYQISEDGKSLSTIAAGGTPQTMAVQELTKDKMVLNREGISITFTETK